MVEGFITYCDYSFHMLIVLPILTYLSFSSNFLGNIFIPDVYLII
jgi:hypothetical protein